MSKRMEEWQRMLGREPLTDEEASKYLDEAAKRVADTQGAEVMTIQFGEVFSVPLPEGFAPPQMETGYSLARNVSCAAEERDE